MADLKTLTGLALGHLLAELTDQPDVENWVFVLSPDTALLPTLRGISAERASRVKHPGGASIAAHVAHLNFCFDLFNRWAEGEENPFADADWEGSFQPGTVDDAAWSALIDEVQTAGKAWRNHAMRPRDWDELGLTGAIGSVAHLAYHLAVIRQLALD